MSFDFIPFHWIAFDFVGFHLISLNSDGFQRISMDFIGLSNSFLQKRAGPFSLNSIGCHWILMDLVGFHSISIRHVDVRLFSCRMYVKLEVFSFEIRSWSYKAKSWAVIN